MTPYVYMPMCCICFERIGGTKMMPNLCMVLLLSCLKRLAIVQIGAKHVYHCVFPDVYLSLGAKISPNSDILVISMCCERN